MAATPGAAARNPFEFGRELAPDELVDRDQELRLIGRVVAHRGKLFLIGPRRFGKTSILNAIDHRVRTAGGVVLRYDAEAYESLAALAQALLTGAARQLTGPLAKAGDVIKRFFARLRPDVNYDLVHHNLSVTIGREAETPKTEVPLLTDVLDGIEKLAAGRKKPVVVILDEFQQVVKEGGESAERQIRAAIQRHRHVSYLFAGSKTRLMSDMTGDPSRAFWKLGERLFLGPVPREDFRTFLSRGFSRSGFKTTAEGIEHILDLAEDVPFNVQRLASSCWERLRVRDDRSLTVAAVDEAIRSVVSQESPAYTQLWIALSRTQKTALKSVIEQGGRELLARASLDRHGLAASSIQRALESLDALGLVRQEESATGIRYRLEDPFFAAWLSLAQAS